VLFWLKLGFISFGGPAAQIAMMHAELVERRRWISEGRFLHALNYCMLLPGPEAQQLAIYVGWLLHRTWGGVVAGTLFVLPSAVTLWVLSYVYVAHGTVPWVVAIFDGLKPAVLAIVVAAVIRIGRKALKNEVMWSVSVLAFASLFFLKLPFPLVMISAGLIGWGGGRLLPRKFAVIEAHGSDAPASVIDHRAGCEAAVKPSLRRALKVVSTCLALWWAPLLLAGLWLGWNHTVFREAVFFSKAAMVTFGGAYAVLPYVSQQAVESHGWLTAGQMLDGLALAETTPGPLIMVLQFVGFLGGWNHPGNLPPLLAATLGAAITTWATFVPCFMWIFLGAPYIELLRGNVRLSAALSTVTAAVVGVVFNLAVWFALHVLFPGAGQVNGFAVGVAITAFLCLVVWRWNVFQVVLGAGLMGLLNGLLFPPG